MLQLESLEKIVFMTKFPFGKLFHGGQRMTLEKDNHLVTDFPSSQKDGVRIAGLRAEIQLCHASHPLFPIGICYYLGLH